jgi:hypothetical protein
MGTKWSSDRWSKLVGLVTLGFAILISASFIPTARAQTPGPCRPQGAVRVAPPMASPVNRCVMVRSGDIANPTRLRLLRP